MIIFDQSQFANAPQIVGIFLVRVLDYRIILLESIVYLYAYHHRTTINVAAIIDFWDESMQMSFLFVHLTVSIELS